MTDDTVPPHGSRSRTPSPRVALLLLAFLLALLLSACSGNGTGTDGSPKAGEAGSTSPPQPGVALAGLEAEADPTPVDPTERHDEEVIEADDPGDMATDSEKAEAEAMNRSRSARDVQGRLVLHLPTPLNQPWRVTCGKGCGAHQGTIYYSVDFQHKSGRSASNYQPILAPAAGVVTQAGWAGGYGNYVVVDHGSGITTHHAHMAAIDVRKGQRVNTHDILGRCGATGNVSPAGAVHLHWEVRVNGRTVDTGLRQGSIYTHRS